MEHNFTKHENCHLTSCMICDGGLGLCTVCKCFEGQLATECPGFDVGNEIGDLIWKGIVDFINGDWIFKTRYKDWWTIKIFTIALLFLITVMPTTGNCGSEDLVLERDGARWYFAGGKIEDPSKPGPENWIHWFGGSGNTKLEQVMSGKITDPERIYTITFHNTDAAHTVLFLLYRIDHGTHHAHDIIPVAAEIPPLEEIFKSLEGGLYYIVWKEQHTGRILKSTNGFRLDKHMEFYYP